jgi:hypothetical protein
MPRRRKKRETVLLVDTGPLVALIDEDDPPHAAVKEALTHLPPRPLLTTWPCLTEAMYLLGTVGGHLPQETLWGYLADGLLRVHDLSATEQRRMRKLMAQYADTPMDLADASLVAVAESRGLRRVLTVDDDFYLYRLADGSVLEVVR